jgi:AcrR family transcriptional regulator
LGAKLARKIPKKSYHHGNLRSTLLEAALILMGRHGVAGLSLREVAKAAGVSHAAPYRHFRDKTALLEAMTVVGFNKIEEGNRKAQKNYPDDYKKQFIEAGVACLNLAFDKPEIIHLMFGGVISFEDCGDELKLAANSAYQSLVTIIANGQQAGVFKPTATRELTFAAWSMVYGLSLMLTGGMMREGVQTKKQLRELAVSLGEVLLSGMLREV